MISERTIRLASDVARVSSEYDLLTARGHSNTVYAVMVRMRLAAMLAELVTTDLVERLQSSVKERT